MFKEIERKAPSGLVVPGVLLAVEAVAIWRIAIPAPPVLDAASLYQ